MQGDNGPDRFVYDAVNFGHDVILDLSQSDRIQMLKSAFADFAAVKAHGAQVGADVLLTLDSNNSILIKKVGLAALGAGDFLFV